MHFSRYNQITFLGVAAILLAVSLVNIIVDPGAVYLRGLLLEIRNGNYVEAMVTSKYGVVQEGWNERNVKLKLAEYASQHDCAIVGSSHVMSISKLRDNRGGLSICESVLNLGVSGGSIEDVVLMMFKLLKDGAPRRLFIGVDPWMFGFDKDVQWKKYSDLYVEAGEYFDLDPRPINTEDSYRQVLLQNLINFDYFRESVKYLGRKGIQEIAAEYQGSLVVDDFKMAEFDLSTGATKSVTLADGSHVYSSGYIQEALAKKHALIDNGYRIDSEKTIDYGAVEVFLKVLRRVLSNGQNVALFLTPYHPNVFDDKNSVSRVAMEDIAPLIGKISRELDIDVFGSYNPDVLGCTGDEFFDFMHPMTECVNGVFSHKNATAY